MNNGGSGKTKRMELGKTGASGGTSKTAGKTLLSSIKKTKFEEALNEELDPPTVLEIGRAHV